MCGCSSGLTGYIFLLRLLEDMLLGASVYYYSNPHLCTPINDDCTPVNDGCTPVNDSYSICTQVGTPANVIYPKCTNEFMAGNPLSSQK